MSVPNVNARLQSTQYDLTTQVIGRLRSLLGNDVADTYWIGLADNGGIAADDVDLGDSAANRNLCMA